MASATQLTEGTQGSSPTGATTAAVTAAGSIQVLHFRVTRNDSTNPATPASLVGGGVTWNLVGQQQFDTVGADRESHFVYVAQGTPAPSSTVTLTLGYTAAAIRWQWIDVTASGVTAINVCTAKGTSGTAEATFADPFVSSTLMFVAWKSGTTIADPSIDGFTTIATHSGNHMLAALKDATDVNPECPLNPSQDWSIVGLQIASSNVCRDYNKQLSGNQGEEFEYVVPNVTSIVVELWGAEGGKGSSEAFPDEELGGYLKVRIPVTPGETLYVYPGGHPPSDGAGSPGGGGDGDTTSGGSPGGGYSAISRTQLPDTSGMLAVAGAGGGLGGLVANAQPGGHGGAAPTDGTPSVGLANSDGKAATSGAGGAGGDGTGGGTNDGDDGAAFQGGDGGPTGGIVVTNQSGGGGGGGWFGGGGGGRDTSSSGRAGGGGGGINGVADGVTILAEDTGVRHGHGEVIVCARLRVPPLRLTQRGDIGDNSPRLHHQAASFQDSIRVGRGGFW